MLGHTGVEQDDGGRVVGRRDDGCGAGDAGLRGGDAHALGEGVDLADALDYGEELVHDAFGFVAFGGQVERSGLSVRMPAPCWTTSRSHMRWLGRTSIT